MTEAERFGHRDWIDVHARVLFPHKEHYLDDGAGATRFYLGRTWEGNIWRVGSGVPDETAAELHHWAQQEPATGDLIPPAYSERYRELLLQHAPISKSWLGPAYRFPLSLPQSHHTNIIITADNIELLNDNHRDWIPDVGVGDPVCALLMKDSIVSVCYSAAKSDLAHEAGVETMSAHRQHGYAADVVAFWADQVRAAGKEPLYSTSSDNRASQAVARHLQLLPIGIDFHLT